MLFEIFEYIIPNMKWYITRFIFQHTIFFYFDVFPYLVLAIFTGTLPKVNFVLTEKKDPVPTSHSLNSLILTKQDTVGMIKSSLLLICWYLKLMSYWLNFDTTDSLLVLLSSTRFNLLTDNLHCWNSCNSLYFAEIYPTIFPAFSEEVCSWNV